MNGVFLGTLKTCDFEGGSRVGKKQSPQKNLVIQGDFFNWSPPQNHKFYESPKKLKKIQSWVAGWPRRQRERSAYGRISKGKGQGIWHIYQCKDGYISNTSLIYIGDMWNFTL